MNQPERAALLPAFDELRPTLDSGDVLLFAGESRFSRAINSRKPGKLPDPQELSGRTADRRQVL
jgi:hypothetical protein